MKKCLSCQVDISNKRKGYKFCSLSCSTRFNRLKILHENLPDNHKRCGKCKSVKRFDEFRKNKNAAFGLSYLCKNCDKARIFTKDKRKILLNAAKARSKKNGLTFDLTIDDIKFPEYCPILGIKLEFNEKYCKDNSYSIDRIDSNKGYVKGNVQIISHKANTMKSNANLNELKKLVEFLENYEKHTI